MSNQKEEYFSDIAVDVAYKKQMEAKAAAAANGDSPPPSIPLDKLFGLAVETFVRGRDKTPDAGKHAIAAIRDQAGITFEKVVNGKAIDQYNERYKLLGSRYRTKPVAEAKSNLDELWKYAKDNDVAPTALIKDSSELQHSSVAMELVSRLTVDQFGAELGNSPGLWFEEAARAYQSIDFSKLTEAQENELRTVFTNAFDHMRELSRQMNEKAGTTVINFPESNDNLWHAVGDYYFSTPIHSDADPQQRVALRAQLRNFQHDLLKNPLIVRDRQDALKKFRDSDLTDRMSTLYPDLGDEVFQIKHRIGQEIQELGAKPEGGGEGGRENTAEARAKAGESMFQYKNRESVQGAGLAGIDQAIQAFNRTKADESTFLPLREKLFQINDLFVERDSMARFDGSGALQTKLRTATRMFEDLERSMSGKSMSGEQLHVLEGYKDSLHAQLEQFAREGEPPNRLYLSKEEQRGLEVDPIGTVERMFIELSQAFAKDPDGPLAKFYMDRMELMQYYLFSKQHGRKLANFDVVVVNGKQALFDAIEHEGQFAGRLVDEAEMFQLQDNVDKAIKGSEARIKIEKGNFERTYINRFHELLFIQQWKHTDSAANENFQRFLNSRMLEDDFWNMDGQFGGLLKDFRMALARRYEAKMFDDNGDRNPHIDRLWDEAIKETAAELKNGDKYSDYKETWDRYINGEFFMEPNDEPGRVSMLRRHDSGSSSDTVTPKITYEEAAEMITQFASFRMIMSQEKYATDLRFLPVLLGKELGSIKKEFFDKDGNPMMLDQEFRTQFYEKQKIGKLANSFEAWMITWGGITNGLTGEEHYMMRHRAKILQANMPELKTWGREWAQDWMDTRIKPFDSKTPDEQKRIIAELKWIYCFPADSMDALPSGNADMIDWIHHLTLDKLAEETTFYASMRASSMAQGLNQYLGVSESGARRDAQFGALNELLGGKEDLTRQNYLTHVDLSSSRAYFQKKMNKDSDEAKMDFLGLKHDRSPSGKGQSFIARYAPHSRLLALREGDSVAARNWVESNASVEVNGQTVKGKKAFGKYYEDLAMYSENIRAELALEEQIDYSKGFGDVGGRQKEAMDKIFGLRLQTTDAGKIAAAEQAYFGQMHNISEFLLNGNEYQKYAGHRATHFGLGALEEFTSVRYGQILVHIRRDDYLYEYVQNPDRAFAKLSKRAGHALYGVSYAKAQADDKLRSLYLTTASDKFEPRSAQDEQSGLWRRNWRDLGASATWWDMTGDRWSLDPKKRQKALEQTYKMIVGVNGNDIAKINAELDEGMVLSFQLVDPKYGQWLKWMYGSSDLNKVNGDMSRLPDELWHEHEQDAKIIGGRSRYTALGAMGMENAVKEVLGVSDWNKRLGGAVGRDKALEWIHHTMPWTKQFLTEKRVEDAMEWLDYTFPRGVIWQKLQIGGAIGILFFILYTFQQTTGEEKKKSSH